MRQATRPCPPWEKFSRYSLEERLPYFSRKDKQPFHVLYARQFTRVFLDEIYILTNKIRLIAKTQYGKKWLSGLLSNHRVMLYFAQPSTRTFLSFATACDIMGMRFYDVRSLETSSEMKGETFEDTVRTFSSYFDLLILRHNKADYAERAAVVLSRSRRPIPVISAGASKLEHPTQALLDIFTLRKSFEKLDGLEGKTILFVGDLRRGRTVRSLVVLLTQFKDVKLIFCAPAAHNISTELKTFLTAAKLTFTETDDFSGQLSAADAIYMTRLQDEYDDHKTAPTTLSYRLTPALLPRLKPASVIMHPLPRRDEIAVDIDNDPRAMYWRQVRNGMWTRCALLAKLFELEEKILAQ